MRRAAISSRRSAQWVVAVLIALATAIGIFWQSKPRPPVADEFFYLSHALPLYQDGTLARQVAPGDRQAFLAAPILPMVIAGAMKLDGDFARRAECWMADPRRAAECGIGFGPMPAITAVFTGIGVAFVFLAGVWLLDSPVAGVLAAAFWLVSREPIRYGDSLLTEPFAVTFFFGATIALTVSIAGRGGIGRVALAGALFGLAALVRPPYVYGGILLGMSLPIVWWWARGQMRLLPAAAFLAAFLAVIGPWEAIKASHGDGAQQFSGYGARALLVRLAFNEMTPREYAAAWLYWLPDFGDDLAIAVMGRDASTRLDVSNPEGIYLGVSSRLFTEAKAATGIDIGLRQPDPHGVVKKYVLGKMLDNFGDHLLVTLVLAWQGVFAGKLVGLFGMAALVAIGFMGRVGRVVLVAALPALLMVFLHAFISLNIPRYNIPILLPMCLAIAVLFLRAIPWRSRSLWIS